MATYYSPSIITNGLVFYYDMLNTAKSWKGQPTTNLCSSNGIHTSWNNSGTATWSSDDQTVTRVFPTVPVLSMYKDTTGNSHIANGYAALAAGLTYTVSTYVYIPSNAGTLAGSVPYMRTFPANTGRGELLYLGSNNWNTWPKDRWLRISNSFVNTANDTEMYISCYLDTAGNKIYMTAPMVEQQSVLSSYVPISSSRSSSQAIADLASTNAISANSLTYNADGAFGFNGSSNYISGSAGVSAKTIVAWCKLSTAAGGDYIVYGLDSNGADNWFGINANKVYALATQSTDVNNFSISGTTNISTTNYCQIACTIDTNTLKVFLNGVEEGSSTQAFTIAAWNSAPVIGRRGSLAQKYFPGNIDSVAAYSRVLTPAEIKQNYDAIRGRYSL